MVYDANRRRRRALRSQKLVYVRIRGTSKCRNFRRFERTFDKSVIDGHDNRCPVPRQVRCASDDRTTYLQAAQDHLWSPVHASASGAHASPNARLRSHAPCRSNIESTIAQTRWPASYTTTSRHPVLQTDKTGACFVPNSHFLSCLLRYTYYVRVNVGYAHVCIPQATNHRV